MLFRSGAHALGLGLERALQQYQAGHFQQGACALAPVADLPMHLRSEHLTIPGYRLPDAWPARLEWLLQRTRASGLRAYAIPLDHDPALAELLPFIVRILLSGSEWQKGN